MGWQDRDYAQVTPRGGGMAPPGWRGSGGSLLLGGSIVTTLIAVNAGIFLLQSFSPSLDSSIFQFGAMQGRAVVHGQIWRLLTAQYLHAGMGHIFINMLVLHFLGRPLERLWSPRRFFTIYTLCGLAGNLFFTLLAAQNVIDPRTPAVGASGCIYGLMGIVAVLFPHATVYIYFLFPLKIRTAAIIFAGISFFTVLQRGSNFGGEACHFAGLVFGAWWAWRGDAWWARTQWSVPRMPKMRMKGGPGGFAAKVEQRREDAETVDRILRKVYEGGIHSLTEREKIALKEATQRQAQREREMGRLDRI
ncbi:MAG: rhomboid family intramembrane serine protease [Phycisphaerae bacterium]